MQKISALYLEISQTSPLTLNEYTEKAPQGFALDFRCLFVTKRKICVNRKNNLVLPVWQQVVAVVLFS